MQKGEYLGGRKRKPGSVSGLEALGRERLSQYFYMRDFLCSEIGNFFQIQNIPDDPNLALHTGRKLASELLDPLVETFGPIAIRSAYRPPQSEQLSRALLLKVYPEAGGTG